MAVFEARVSGRTPLGDGVSLLRVASAAHMALLDCDRYWHDGTYDIGFRAQDARSVALLNLVSICQGVANCLHTLGAEPGELENKARTDHLVSEACCRTIIAGAGRLIVTWETDSPEEITPLDLSDDGQTQGSAHDGA